MHFKANGARYQYYVHMKRLVCTYLDKQMETGNKIRRRSNAKIELYVH